MKPSKKSDIQEAVEKMELESARTKKSRGAAPQAAPKENPIKAEREERIRTINKQGKNDFEEIINRLKGRAILVSLIILVTLLYTSSLSNIDRVSLLHDAIILFVACGLVLAAAYKR